MTVAINPKYRNTRENYYTDKQADSQSIGTIVQVLKSTDDSYDHQYVPSLLPNSGGSTKYDEVTGDAEPEINPEYQYPGFIYCDGAEYNILDYPALYEAIGNDYGGIASDGIDVISSDLGWSGTITGLIDAPPSGENQLFEDIPPVQATCEIIVAENQIVGIETLNPGRGYDVNNPPTITFTSSNGNSGIGTVTYNIRISADVGQITSINRNNIWKYWPDQYMGTFKVPDLKAKRIVGNGPVYGNNTPNVGNSDLGVGINTIDGNWYMDKLAQKDQFSLGNITTTNYSGVVDTVEGSIIGQQVVSVTLAEKKLAGPPQHSHFLFHSEVPQDVGMPLTVSGERYAVHYKPSTGKVNQFTPPSGQQFQHGHVLSKAPILDASVGTYDIYNWSGGDEQSGSIKEPGYYYASGGAGAGSFVEQTGYGSPIIKTFTSGSLIGGRPIVTGGVPVYDTETIEYQTAGNFNVQVPADIDEAIVTLVGGGGSGAVYSNDGNNGGSSRIDIAGGSILRLDCGGGSKGGAASTNSGGLGGAVGANTITGSGSGNVTVLQQGGGTGYAGGDGGSGPYWKKALADPSDTPGDAEGSAGENPTGRDGTKGRTRIINNTVDVEYNFPYNSGTQTWTNNPTNANYGINSITAELWGGGGRDCGNYSGNNCNNNPNVTRGRGGAGRYMKIAISNLAEGLEYRIQTGQSGRAYNGQAAAAHSGKGGRAGNGYGSNDGGGGGAATVLRRTTGNTIIAGAGGGGGGGGFGEGVCGQDGRSANDPGNSVIETSQNLFTGTGATGGNYGCTGGGGGGGGGGVGRSTDTQGGNPGAGGGGSGGHEQGFGGRRGLSAIRTDYISSVISQSNGNPYETNGKAKITVNEERGYWTSGGGGGGSGGYLKVKIKKDEFAGQSSIALTVGEGGAGVSQGGVSSATCSDGYAKILWQTIVGYEGGTESITTGDVFIAGSGSNDNGVNFFATGSGAGNDGGFKLPTTQVPTVVFEGGGGGSGATATAIVAGNKVDSLTLDTPGSGYTAAPRVRILGGVGIQNHATVGFNAETGQLENLQLQTSVAPTHYLKFGGTQNDRNVVLDTVDATDFQRVTVKVARGNGKNGGDLPEQGGDELLLYYNTDESLNFPGSGFIGILVPLPTQQEIDNDYDGDGTGNNATNWYTYGIELPQDAQTENVRFSIRQNRGAATNANDNDENTDNYGILEVRFENQQTTELVFVASEGKIAVINDTQTYSVGGPINSTYVSGIFANDSTLTLQSATPIIPIAALDPDQVIPLIEPYMLVKYLIKAF